MSLLRPSIFRVWCRLTGLGCLLACMTNPVVAGTELATQVAAMEAVARTYFRGVPLPAEQAALAARVERYNTALARRQAELSGDSQSLNAALAPVRELEALINRSAARLAKRPSPNDAAAVRKYNGYVEEHNRLVARHDKEVERVRPSLEAQEQRVARVQQEFAREGAALEKARAALERRRTEWEAFTANEGDVHYQMQVNRLLADLREAGSAGRGRSELLARVRALRRELAAWAVARYAAEPNGLILVSAMVGDEPCQFIFDTGAQTVTVPEDIVRALGWQARLGVTEPIRGVGGGKVQGRLLVIPSITVLGRSVSEVGASALSKPEGVGVDGLLGQSFLKTFRITITPGASVPVQLDPQ